jgi:hypothetical protein
MFNIGTQFFEKLSVSKKTSGNPSPITPRDSKTQGLNSPLRIPEHSDFTSVQGFQNMGILFKDSIHQGFH